MERLNLLEVLKKKYTYSINPKLIYVGLLQTSKDVFLEKIVDDEPEHLVQHNLEQIYDKELIHLQPILQGCLFNPLIPIGDNATRFLLLMDPLSIMLNFEGVFTEDATDRLLKYI
jgi:hypothetical protein